MTYTFIELDGSTRRIKKSNAKKILHHYEPVGARTFRRIVKPVFEVVRLEYTEVFPEYDYPEFSLIAITPGNIYPTEIARDQRTCAYSL